MNFTDYLLLVIQYTEDRAMCLRHQSELWTLFCAESTIEYAAETILFMQSKPGQEGSI